MNKTKTLAIIYVYLQIFCVAFVLGTASHLPSLVASHFDVSGQPDATMPKEQYIGIFLAIMVLIPSGLAFLPRVIAKLPHHLINLPNRAYWLASERVGVTQKILQVYFLVLSCLLICFMAFIYGLMVIANQQNPPSISGTYLAISSGLFVVLTLYWAYRLNLRFSDIPS
jgi:hypothetical protein